MESAPLPSWLSAPLNASLCARRRLFASAYQSRLTAEGDKSLTELKPLMLTCGPRGLLHGSDFSSWEYRQSDVDRISTLASSFPQ